MTTTFLVFLGTLPLSLAAVPNQPGSLTTINRPEDVSPRIGPSDVPSGREVRFEQEARERLNRLTDRIVVLQTKIAGVPEQLRSKLREDLSVMLSNRAEIDDLIKAPIRIEEKKLRISQALQQLDQKVRGDEVQFENR